MIDRILLVCCLAIGLPLAGHGQDAASAPVEIRAVLHDPIQPTADLFLLEEKGKIVRLGLVPEGLSATQKVMSDKGSIALYKTATPDPKNLAASLVATLKIPANARKVMVVFFRMPAGQQPMFKGVVIEDTAQAFPAGTSQCLNLLPIESAIEIGEHKLPVKPGTLIKVPEVRKRDAFNMAQANFYIKKDGAWEPFEERQLQFLKDYRRIFIVHRTPGALSPSINTILDVAPAVIPQAVETAPKTTPPKATTRG